jgi:hypothetical protein
VGPLRTIHDCFRTKTKIYFSVVAHKISLPVDGVCGRDTIDFPPFFHVHSLTYKEYKYVAQIVAHRLAGPSSNLGSAPLEEALYRADAMRITRAVLYE